MAVFGDYLPGRSGQRDLTSPSPGPVLKLHMTSGGGSLYVRDYPDNVDPRDAPNRPGFPVAPELRPNLRGLSKRQARYELRAWGVRHAAEVRSQQFVAQNIPGPCAIPTGPAG